MTREQNDKEGPIEEQDIESSEEISYTSDTTLAKSLRNSRRN